MIYDPERDEKMEKKSQEETEGQKIEIISQHIIIGKQGAALSIPECEFVKKMVQCNRFCATCVFICMKIGKQKI